MRHITRVDDATRERALCSVEGGDDLYSSVEAVDEHLAGPDLTGNVRGVFDRVVKVREPFDVFSSTPKTPGAVWLLDNPKEEPRHASSIDAISKNSYECASVT